MKLRHIILFGLMVISPLLLAARNEVGSQGGGCGCPWITGGDGSDKAIENTGEEQPDTGGETTGDATIVKSVFDYVPEMDTIIIIKTDQVFPSKLWKAFSGISEENSSLDGLLSLFKKGELSIGKSASLSKGLSKVEEAISANDTNLIIAGASFDWSAMDPKVIFADNMENKPDTSPKLKNLFGMVVSTPAVAKDIADLLEGIITKMEDSLEIEVGDKKLIAYKGPEVCDGENDERVCKNLALYINQIEDGITMVATEDIMKSYYENAMASATGAKTGGLKNNDTWKMIQTLMMNGSNPAVLAAGSTQFMQKIKDYANGPDVSDGFKKNVPLFWLGDIPSYLACGVGISVLGNIGVTVNCSVLDPAKPDLTFSFEIGEDLANSINWTGLKELKLFENEDCGDGMPVTCSDMKNEDACEGAYTMLGGKEARHCFWDGEDSKCYVQGNYGEDEGRCSIGEEFNISFGYNTAEITAGSSIDVPITVMRNNNFNGEIAFQVVGNPLPGMTISFNPTDKCSSTCSGSNVVFAHIELSEDAIIEEGTDFYLKVKGTSGSIWSETGVVTITMNPNQLAP